MKALLWCLLFACVAFMLALELIAYLCGMRKQYNQFGHGNAPYGL